MDDLVFKARTAHLAYQRSEMTRYTERCVEIQEENVQMEAQNLAHREEVKALEAALLQEKQMKEEILQEIAKLREELEKRQKKEEE